MSQGIVLTEAEREALERSRGLLQFTAIRRSSSLEYAEQCSADALAIESLLARAGATEGAVMNYDQLLRDFVTKAVEGQGVQDFGYLLIPDDKRLNDEALHNLKQRFKEFTARAEQESSNEK